MMMMMMGQNQNENRRGSSSSTSRLSASAKPFTMNNQLTNPQPISKFSSFAPQAFDPSLDLWQPISSSVSGLEQRSLINLEEDNLSIGAYDCHGFHSAVPFDQLKEVGAEPYYPQYLSEGFQDHSDFDMGLGSLTLSKTSQPIHAPNQLSIGVREQGKRVDNQGSFCWIEENDNGLMPSEALLKQGKALVAEDLNSHRESSNCLPRKCRNLTEKSNQTTFGGTEQTDAKGLSLKVNELTHSNFSSSSDMHSAAPLNDVNQSQVSYQEPVVRWSNFTLGGSSSEGSFSHIDSYSDKTTVPHSEGKSYVPSFVFGSSSAIAISSLNTHVFSDNLNFGVSTALTNTQKELCFIPSAESKGKDKIIDKPISSELLSPLKVAKSAPQITSDDFSLKHHGVEMCDPVQSSSRSDDADLDLDSPCWKGNQNSIRSPFGVSQPVNLDHGENEVEAHNSLNPMAPHFFPRYGKSSVCQTSFIENDITSFQKSPISGENLKSRENEVQIGLCSLEMKVCSSGIHTQSSDGILELNAGNELLNVSNFGAVLNPSQPYFVEDYFNSKDKVSSEEAVASSLKGIKEGAAQVSTFVSSASAKCVPSSSHPRVDVPSKTFQDVPDYSYTSSGIDGHMLVKAMSDLSESLVQNFSNDLDPHPLDELDHDAIQHIINNLYLCIQRDEQRTLMPKSSHPEISYCLEKSADLQKVQVTRTKAITFSHGKGDERQVLGSCSGYGVEEGDQISKVMKKVCKGDPLKEEAHLQTKLYRNLWLEAEAALCAMKYRAHLFRMETEMGHSRISGRDKARDIVHALGYL